MGAELSTGILTGNPSPLWLAVDGRHEGLVTTLLEMVKKCSSTVRPESSQDGTSPLEIATAHGHRGIMRKLLDYKVFDEQEVMQVCRKFGDREFLNQNLDNPLQKLTQKFPIYNESVVEDSKINLER